MPIADAIGADTRFRSLEMTATGDPKHSYSCRSAGRHQPREVSPVALYARLFGPDFQDPNAADFKPDPSVMLRKSVLSAIKDQRDAFEASWAAPTGRGWTSISPRSGSSSSSSICSCRSRRRPKPAHVAQSRPTAPVGTEIGMAIANHKLMAQILAMALACNQTKVFNMVFSDSASSLRKAGSTSPTIS